MTTKARTLAALGLVAACCIAAPAGAGAATTIGSDLSTNPALQCGAGAGDPCNFVTQTLASGAPDTGSPVAGVIVSAKVRTTGAAVTLAVRVLRENAMTAFTFLNVGPEAAIPVTDDLTLGGHQTAATGLHLPIAVGDQLGLGYVNPSSPNPVRFGGINGSAACSYLQGAGQTHPVGTERSYNNAGCSAELLVQASIEPDADGDLYGDETQDLCPTNAALQTACPSTAPPTQPGPAPTKKKKCKKAKKKSAAAAKKKCKKKR